MRAVVVGEGWAEMAEVPEPQPKAGEVKVKVRACGLNRADVMVASGRAYGRVGGKGTVVGTEWAGEVAAVGAGVTGFRAGDRVMGSGPAGFAEFAVADAGRVTRIPTNNMTFAQAATLPIALQTMYDAVATNGRLVAGETILMQGASSGVGLIGMQIAKLKGAKLVIGTSTDPGRRARLKEFGADLALDSRDPGWVQLVLDATGGAGVDLIVDQVSGYVASQNLAATRILGRIVNVGRLGGMKGEFDFDLHALR
ncbi:MAG: zinc-binding dehydrogenase, partial [Alphaproteobacteria bacterium]|nr:zinc-binding dehydrogenase [Alphaproteobacteria bacterium]